MKNPDVKTASGFLSLEFEVILGIVIRDILNHSVQAFCIIRQQAFLHIVA